VKRTGSMLAVAAVLAVAGHAEAGTPDWRSYVVAPESREVPPEAVLSASDAVSDSRGVLAPGGRSARLSRRVVAGRERWPAGSAADASSADRPASGAIDGTADTAWSDGTPDAFPDVLTVTAPEPVALPGVTLVASSRNWPRDFTVETWDGRRWVRQEAVTGNDQLTRAVRFDRPVTTDRVRVTITAAYGNPRFPVQEPARSTVTELVPGVVSEPVLELDFGKVVAGRLEIGFAGASDPEPGVRVAFSERRRHLEPRSDYSHSDYGPDDAPGGADAGPGTDQHVPTGGREVWEDRRGCRFGDRVCAEGVRGFRYVRIYLGAAEGDAQHAASYGTVSIDHVRVNFTPYLGTPDRYEGHFLSSDELLNRIWYASTYTAELNTTVFDAADTDPRACDSATLQGKRVIHDGAKRDRCPYAGGTDIVTLANAVSHPDPEPTRNVLADFAARQRPDGSVPGSPIFDYSGQYPDAQARWVTILHKYVLYSGDLDFARRHWGTLERILDAWFPPRVTAHGTVLDHQFLTAEYVIALRNAADLANALADGPTPQATGWRERADRAAAAIEARFWDPVAGAYFQSESERCHSQYGNVLAVLGGIADAARADAALDHFAGLALPWGNPYNDDPLECALFGIPTEQLVYAEGGAYEMWARFERNRPREALEQLRRTFGWQLRHDPYSTLWEGYAVDGEPDTFFGPAFTSMAHGHMAGGAPVLTAELLGVRPAGFGYRTYDVAPRPGDVGWARGRVPTPAGPIVVDWRRSDGGRRFELELTAPDGLTGRAGVPTFGRRALVWRDGRLVWDGERARDGADARSDGTFVYIEGIDPGRHRIVSIGVGQPVAPPEGVAARVTAARSEVHPGETVRVTATLTNDSEETLRDVELAVRAPDGWRVDPAGKVSDSLVRPGERVTARFDVRVPRDEPPTGAVRLEGVAGYRYGTRSAERGAATTLAVRSPLAIAGLAAEPKAFDPGGATTVTARLENVSAVPVEGELRLEAPDGWEIAPPARAYSLAAGAATELTFAVRSPAGEQRASAQLEAIAGYFGTEGARRSVRVYLAPPPAADAYLSDVPWIEASSGHATVQRDRSVLGREIAIGGRTYAKGLGTHAPSRVLYYLGGNCSRLTADVGVDDVVEANGSVAFQVMADGERIYDSGVLRGSSPTARVDVAIAGVDELELIVTDGGDANAFDHADWGDAFVRCGGA
jgi:NPCBM/NEW2 domain/NPCBM-associated, NEW3 domain of alpha-galactosidase/F5/8 type C domain/Bacterial alpha-L-rhamnosidase C-terminal domain